MNEEKQQDGRASNTSGTSFNSRNEYCKDLDLLYTRNHFEKKMGTRTTWRSRSFTNMEEIVTLGERRTCEAPFKGFENSTCDPLL